MSTEESDSQETCIACRKPKGGFQCGVCQETVCKSCVETLKEDAFSFREKIDEDLKHTRYCPSCYSSKVEPELEKYEETMAQAREAYIFFKTQRSGIPIVSKSKETLKISACVDRDEAILRLAFWAIERGFNAVIETEVIAEKVRNEGWQKSNWRGSGVPAQVDVAKLERQR